MGNDDDATWLARLAEGDYQEQAWLEGLERDGLDEATSAVFSHLPPLAAALGWLVLSHHRLPLKPVSTTRWRERATKLATRLQARLDKDGHWLESHYVMHLARLSLMLADHHYSSLEDPLHRVRGESNYPLVANTVRKTGKPNQPLDEHILGVEKHAAAAARALPSVDSHLPRLARHKGFRKRSSHPRFRWQDKAFDLAQSLRERSQRQGFFGINMASTGCGKTLANGRIMYALADPQQMNSPCA